MMTEAGEAKVLPFPELCRELMQVLMDSNVL